MGRLDVPVILTTMRDLPPSEATTLALLHPTAEEKIAIWNLNGQIWRGNMDLPTYIRREKHLENQAFTKDGGITFWILVDSTLAPNERPILASCESLRKRALIADGNGQVTDIVSHGIGSVFCNPEYRGRGYAQRMITELGNKLDNWQQKQGERTSFTILYSDIGKVGRSNQYLVSRVVDMCHRTFIQNWVGMHFHRATLPYCPSTHMNRSQPTSSLQVT